MPELTNPSGSEAITAEQAMQLFYDRAAEQESAKPDEQQQEPERQVEAGEATEQEVEGEAQDADAETEGEVEQSEEQAEVEAQPPKEQLFPVILDGQEQRVTLQELLAGYQRHADYTRKTQELAEQRRQADSEAQAARKLRDDYAQQLGQLKQLLSQPEKKPDFPWDTDPVQAARMAHEWNERQEQRRAAAAEVAAEEQKLRDQQAAEQRKLQETAIAEARARLPVLIPEWRDEQVAAREKQAVLSYAQKAGFTPQEIQNATDPRAIAVLRKAHLYDELMAKKPIVTKKVAAAPKMTKGNAPKQRVDTETAKMRELDQRFAKNPTRDSAMALLEARELQRMR